jgi:hypothetical protein
VSFVAVKAHTMRMPSLSEPSKIDLAVLFLGGVALLIGCLLLLDIALVRLSGL